MSSLLVHIGVRATNLGKTIRFWRDGLGLKVVEQTDTHFDLTDGYHNFRVFQHDGPARPPHVTNMLDYLHLGVRVPDLKKALDRCHELGFRVVCEGVDGTPYDPNHPPVGAFKVADPDGIVVDISVDRNQWPGVEIQERNSGQKTKAKKAKK